MLGNAAAVSGDGAPTLLQQGQGANNNYNMALKLNAPAQAQPQPQAQALHNINKINKATILHAPPQRVGQGVGGGGGVHPPLLLHAATTADPLPNTL